MKRHLTGEYLPIVTNMLRGWSNDKERGKMANLSKSRNVQAEVGSWFPTLGLLILWWGWMPLVWLIGWGLSNWITPGMGSWHLGFNQVFNVWLVHQTGLFWIWIIIGLIGSLIIIGSMYFSQDEDAPGFHGILALGTTALLVFGLWQYIATVWDDDKDEARYYNSKNIFVVQNLHNPPNSMTKLINGHNATGNGKPCDLEGPSGDDVHTCIVQGNPVSAINFEPRVSSYDGAITVIKRTSGSLSGVSLDENSVEYLNTSDTQGAAWSGVLDGSGRYNHMQGVAEWDGRENIPTVCKFNSTDYQADRAVSGSRGNSLPNILNDVYPALQFHYDDYWGYCKGKTATDPGKPVIVFPVTRQQTWMRRIVDAPAGVVVLTGGNDGFNYHYEADVSPGEFPGPVYPISTTDRQIKAATWAGGRKLEENNFGFEASTSAAQSTNPSDYLLESAVDHRLYWVTPLTPRYSSSQLFVAYSLTPADEVHQNQLNTTKFYVMPDDQLFNVDTMEATARQFLITNEPGFISSGGHLLEFIPQKDNEFRAYGEVSGRVVLRLDVDARRQVVSEFVALEGSGADKPVSSVPGVVPGTPTPVTPGGPTVPPLPAGKLDCNNPDKLTAAQIGQCLDKLSKALQSK